MAGQQITQNMDNFKSQGNTIKFVKDLATGVVRVINQDSIQADPVQIHRNSISMQEYSNCLIPNPNQSQLKVNHNPISSSPSSKQIEKDGRVARKGEQGSNPSLQHKQTVVLNQQPGTLNVQMNPQRMQTMGKQQLMGINQIMAMSQQQNSASLNNMFLNPKVGLKEHKQNSQKKLAPSQGMEQTALDHSVKQITLNQPVSRLQMNGQSQIGINVERYQTYANIPELENGMASAHKQKYQSG
jgi:hypothetical protein